MKYFENYPPIFIPENFSHAVGKSKLSRGVSNFHMTVWSFARVLKSKMKFDKLSQLCLAGTTVLDFHLRI